MAFANIVQVYEEVDGSELAADAALAATTVTVVDPADFSPDGGTILLTGTTPDTVDYDTVDDTTGIITLAAGLAAAHLAGDFATVQPLSVTRIAEVSQEDQPESLLARVPHALYDRLPVGLRDQAVGDSELVELARDDENLLVIGDVIDREPSVDGSFIDTATLPAAGTDGAPPAASPTAVVQGGIGSLFVSWTATANSDPVAYEVHVSTTTGFTPGAGTLAVTTDATQAVLRTLPDTTPLDYATTYYIRLIATDADGAAAAGTEGAASPAQVTSPDIAAEAVSADKVLANSITADQIATVLQIAGTMETASEGQRVVIDASGIHLYDSAGNELVAVPTDDAKSPTFRGDVVTGGLTVLDQMLIQGAANALDKGAELTLNAQLASPGSTPTLAFEYETTGFASNASAFRGLDYSTTGGAGGATTCYYTVGDLGGAWVLYEVDASTMTVLRTKTLQADTDIDYGGCVQIGSYVWTLWRRTDIGNIRLQAYNLSDLSSASSTAIFLGGVTTKGLALGTDGTNLYIASWAGSGSSSRPEIDLYTVTGSTPTPASSSPMSGAGGVTYGTGDRIIVAVGARQASTICLATEDRSGTNRVTSFELYNLGTLVKLTTDGHTWCPDAVTSAGNLVFQAGGGVTYDGTTYHSIRRAAPTITNYSGWVWTAGTNSDEWWVGYQWYQATGPYHSKLSPLASVVLNGGSVAIGRGVAAQVAMRGQIRVVSPSLPADAGDTQVYMLPASAAPTLTTLKLQSPFGHSSGGGSYTQYIRAYASGGAAYVDTNTFPGGGTSKIRSSGGVTAAWQLGGDDTLLLPRSTVAQRPGAPAKADLRWNEDRSNVETYDGTACRSVGMEIVTPTISISSVPANSATTQSITITGLNVGDLCFWLGLDAAQKLVFSTQPICATAGQIVLNISNPDSAAHAFASHVHTFGIVRRT